MRFDPTAIVVHCSASQWGCARSIDEWHRTNGWSGIGYHGVIMNGRPEPCSVYDEGLDGRFQVGRNEGVAGAHCKAGGMNKVALGVCLIGTPGFAPIGGQVAPEWCFQGLTRAKRQSVAYCTQAQFARLVLKCADWCERYGISPWAIHQHSEFDRSKPLCASLNIRYLRRRVEETIK